MVDKNTSTRTYVIPSADGWHVVEPLSGDDGIDGVDLLPIVAWVIGYDVREGELGGDVVSTWVHPVVADVVLHTTSIDGPVLRRPDGRYVIAENREFETQADVIEYLRGCAQQRQQSREAKQAQDGDTVPAGDLF